MIQKLTQLQREVDRLKRVEYPAGKGFTPFLSKVCLTSGSGLVGTISYKASNIGVPVNAKAVAITLLATWATSGAQAVRVHPFGTGSSDWSVVARAVQVGSTYGDYVSGIVPLGSETRLSVTRTVVAPATFELHVVGYFT